MKPVRRDNEPDVFNQSVQVLSRQLFVRPVSLHRGESSTVVLLMLNLIWLCVVGFFV